MFSEDMAGNYTKKEFGAGPDENLSLLQNSNGTKILVKGAEPVRLSPGWEGTSRPDDELNFKTIKMDQLELEHNPPFDRLKLVYLIMLIHGIGALTPWNMFITAKDYFEGYKLNANYTGTNFTDYNYGVNFVTLAGFASQVPNVFFSWMNIFMTFGGSLTKRVVWGILVEGVVFIITISLAMVDSRDWPVEFFWITMILIVILNTAGGIYQNSVFGMAAKLPGSYTGAVVLGSNISGVLTSVVSILSKEFAKSEQKKAAIYYFCTALFILVVCFDTYFALPLSRFYRYHELMYQKEIEKKRLASIAAKKSKAPPFWKIFRQCWVQCFNVWFVFFVTLTIFPAVQSNVHRSDENFFISEKYYTDVMCFLCFNITAMIGSYLASVFQWPSSKYLVIPVFLRALFIPLFLFCNYYRKGDDRILPIYIQDDWIFLALGITMGLSSGYFSSTAMMYCPKVVEPQYATTAGMYGAAFLVTGVLSGILFAYIMPYIITSVVF